MTGQVALRFKIDENSPFEFVQMLRDAGFDAEHALDEALGGKSDATLAAFAQGEGRAIVTLDLDFADVRRFPPADYAGILVLRAEVQSRTRLMAVFAKVISLLAAEQLHGRLWIADESGVRVRE